jgi:quinoprotein glucose dehydrogenase
MAAGFRQIGWGTRLIWITLTLIGLVLAGGGGYLASLGGSAYYLLAGLGCLFSAYLYQTGQRGGLSVFLAVFLGTTGWALWEVGTDLWQLLPRVAGPLVIAVALILHDIARRQGVRAALIPSALAMVAAFVALAGLRSLPEVSGGTAPLTTLAQAEGTDWTAYGQNPGGTRFSPAAQLTAANVGGLELAWSYRTGDGAKPGEMVSPAFQATPLKVGDTLYLCSGRNRVIALDAETGAERWSHDPKIDITKTVLLNCRGVSYYEAPAGTSECPRRIITGTLDARLIALDADSGKPCPGFGTNGTVDLTGGLGAIKPGQYSVTSPPVVANGVIVVNGFVLDGLTADAPGGVIRAFDAMTGALRWAWDPGRENENEALAVGETFRRDTPNSWSVMSVDPALGMVYVPTGNSTPDYVGMHRTALSDRYNSSVIALDLASGQRRWNFQTVHHDIFDLDVPAQPVLFDWPLVDGSTVPALAQPTKQGYIFLLDRRTGKPLLPVAERPVPRGSVKGERYSPTQPAQTGIPNLIPPALTEADMWGATAIDQMLCRIRFRQLDYRGPFTPPSMTGSLQFPGNFGILNWGSVTVDPRNQVLVANVSYMPITTRLVPRALADQRMKKEGFHVGFVPQEGTPFGVESPPLLSALGLPCTAPPWGRIAAIDLKTRKLLWNKPLGTSSDHAPLGIAVPGVFNIGGPITTAGGVTFIGAAIDRYVRAIDTRTGAELWRHQAPTAALATPMTYVSGKSGRQFVVIAAGGSGLLQSPTGDHVLAFALPRQK